MVTTYVRKAFIGGKGGAFGVLVFGKWIKTSCIKRRWWYDLITVQHDTPPVHTMPRLEFEQHSASLLITG